MDEDVPVVPERGVIVASLIAYATAGLVAAGAFARMPRYELRTTIALLRDAGAASTLAAAIGLLLVPIALHRRTHALLRGLPLYGAAGALVISPALLARDLLARAPRPDASHPLSLTFGIDAYVEWLALLAPCAALAAAVSLGVAVGYRARRAAFGRLLGMPQTSVALAVAAIGSFGAASLLAHDLRVVVDSADVTQLRVNDANAMVYGSRLLGLLLAILAARAARETVAETAVRAAGPALIVGLFLPLFGERLLLERLATLASNDRNGGPSLTLPEVRVAGHAHVDPHRAFHGRLFSARLEPPGGRIVPTQRPLLAAYLRATFPQELPPPVQDEGGNVRCAQQRFPRNELVLLADADLSSEALRTLVAACEDARISTLTFVFRDATVTRLGGDHPLVRLIPPVLTASSVLLSPTRESCITTYGRTSVQPLPYDSLRSLADDARADSSAIDASTGLFTVDPARVSRGRPVR